MEQENLAEQLCGVEAALLPILHAYHDRDGFLSDDALRQTSHALKIPIAELFGTVSFYHHFSRVPAGKNVPKVCTGPVCVLKGAGELLASMRAEQAIPMPCCGRCDQPVPVLRGDHMEEGLSTEFASGDPSPVPLRNPGGFEECVFADIRKNRRASIEGYLASGGYEALKRFVQKGTPAEIIDCLEQSGLTGRGGAGFPTGSKWRAVAEAAGSPKTIVCNADEGEPGCFKDRALLDHDPHAVIEGMLLAARATGATRGFIYLRYEYPQTLAVFQVAMDAARQAGYLGSSILAADFDFELHIRRGAGAYICGEEGSLLNSLEGKHPFPRNRPPYPVTHGYMDLPTVVNNVETLASVPQILKKGADWYRGLGLGEHAGAKVISISGDIARPGNYEVPMGLPLSTLLHDWAGGPGGGRSIQAVTMAGLSGGYLAGEDLNVSLDEPSIRSKGSFLGAGGIIVYDDTRNMMDAAHAAMSFFADESCGKCFPCRIGTKRLEERLAVTHGPGDFDAWAREVESIGNTMKATSACGLGMAAPLVTDSLVRYFEEAVRSGLSRRENQGEACQR